MSGAALENSAPGKTAARWLWLSLTVLALDRATKFAIEHYTGAAYRQSIVPGVVAVCWTAVTVVSP